MTFDPEKYLEVNRNGSRHLPIAARLRWFREDHPDWGIVTESVQIDVEKQFAIFLCSIYDNNTQLITTATKMESGHSFAEFIERAEWGAIGRALAFCGYGIEYATELETDNHPGNALPIPPVVTSGKQSDIIARAAGRPASTDTSSGIVRVREKSHDYADPGGSDEIEDESLLEEDESFEGWSDSAPTIAKTNPLAGNRCSVEGCSIVLTAGQMTMSKNKFGRPICLLHQKDAVPTTNGHTPQRRNQDD